MISKVQFHECGLQVIIVVYPRGISFTHVSSTG